jgi:CopG family nickel-responsive transcriptional regulator
MARESQAEVNGGVQRISVSLPEAVFRELDELVALRGLGNRSKAVAEMITQAAAEHRQEVGDDVMAGIITLVYDECRGQLLQKLAALERQHVSEVISSLHVQLENNHRLEVVLVQGQAHKLRQIADALSACHGVLTSRLTLSSRIMPPLFSQTNSTKRQKPSS